MLRLERLVPSMDLLYVVLSVANTSVAGNASIIEKIASIPFFEVYLSTFLGFLSALIIETISDYVTSKQKRKQIIKNLIIELETVKNEVKSLEDKKLYPLPYSIPFWKGICLSGSVLNLDKMNCYAALVCIFEKVEEANYMEGKCFEIVLSSPQKNIDKNMLKTILENRKQLLNEIDKGLQLLREVK